MGFRIEPDVYNLVFDGTPFEGLTIKAEAMTMDERLNAYFILQPSKDDTFDEGKIKQEKRFQMFLDHVVDWDMEDRHGNQVPITVEGLFKVCTPEQAGQILGAWVAGRMTVPAPLEPESPGTSLAAIPMTVLESTPEPVSSNAC